MTDSTSSSSSPHQDRLSHLLSVSIQMAQAAGGAIWLKNNSGSVALAVQQGLGDQPLDQAQQEWPGHAETIAEVFESATAQSLAARFELNAGRSQSLQLIMLPLRASNAGEGVLELFLPPRETPSSTEVISRIESLLTLLQQSDSAQGAAAFATWLSKIHESVELSKTAFLLANETKAWSQWDRVSVLKMRARKMVVVAISGLDSFDRRSGAVRELEGLCSRLGEFKDFPSHTHPDVQAYRERVQATTVQVMPLTADTDELLGIMVFENFHENQNARSVAQLALAQIPAASALRNAIEYERARSNMFIQTVHSLTSYRFAKLLLFSGMVGALVAALCLIQTDLTIRGTGSLHPVQRRDIFANSDGIVKMLHVQHGDAVAEGDPLITLESPELEFDIKRIKGERDTIVQQITDLETLSGSPRLNANGETSAEELAARIEELKSTLTGLDTQLELLQQQANQLEIKSTLTGTVLTWEVENLLENRPVRRTDRLLSVARLDGPWVLELQVDHRDIGPILSAFRERTARIAFVTASDPQHPHPATLNEVAAAVSIDPTFGPVLEMTASIDQHNLPAVQPGTTVIPRITCGRSAIGYVWFRHLVDSVRGWWALW